MKGNKKILKYANEDICPIRTNTCFKKVTWSSHSTDLQGSLLNLVCNKSWTALWIYILLIYGRLSIY